MKYSLRSYGCFAITPVITILIIIVVQGCSGTRAASEGSLVVTRKYVGNFLDYRLTDSKGPLTPDIFWIKTTLEGQYGKIGVYARGDMEFTPEERLYLRKYYFQNPAMGSWEYRLESGNQQVFYVIYGTSIDPNRKSALNRLFGVKQNGD